MLLIIVLWFCTQVLGTTQVHFTYGERPLPNMVLYPGTRYYLWDSWPSLVRPASARGTLDQFPLTPLLSPVHALHKWPPALHRTAAYWKHTLLEKSQTNITLDQFPAHTPISSHAVHKWTPLQHQALHPTYSILLWTAGLLRGLMQYHRVQCSHFKCTDCHLAFCSIRAVE